MVNDIDFQKPTAQMDMSVFLPRLCDAWKLSLVSEFPSMASYFGYNNKLTGRYATLLFAMHPDVNRFDIYKCVWYSETMPNLPFDDPKDGDKNSIISLVYTNRTSPVKDLRGVTIKVEPKQEQRSKTSHFLQYFSTALMVAMLFKG